jgi:hypothetical protein
MNSVKTLLADLEPLPQWLNFLIMAGVLLFVALGCLVWFVLFRKKKKRRKRRPLHYQREQQVHPTLAETGGLPPPRSRRPPGPNPKP